MSQTNAPNLALTGEEMSILRYIFTHGNNVTMPELKREMALSGVESKAVETALVMMLAQEFMVRRAMPRVTGGYTYSIALKSIKKIRAERAAVHSDRQVVVR